MNPKDMEIKDMRNRGYEPWEGYEMGFYEA